jgi:serine protease Do
MGLSFAIPIEVAMDVVDQLKTSGKVSRGWLGVLIQDVTLALAESFGMQQPRGALVAKVLPGSPAEDAGIRVGDVIVAFDGKQVDHSSSLPPIVGSTKVGVKIPVDVIRNGKEKTVRVKLGELPEDETQARKSEPEAEKVNRVGLGVVDLTEEQRTELEIGNGVLVNRVVNGAASKAGIREGDVILSIDNKPVKSAKQFQAMVKGLSAGKSVAVLLQRKGSPTFLAIKVPDDA